MTLPALRERILKTSAGAKERLPWLKLAKFGSKRSNKGSLRHNDNVIEISGVEVDYDGEVVTLGEAVRILKKVGLRALVYTSPSHTVAKPRWRILAPTSRELPPEERTKLVARLNGILGGILAPESFTLSQSYYYGSVDNNAQHRAVIIEGDSIDLRADLDNGAIGNDFNSQHTSNEKLVADDVEELKAAVEAIPNNLNDYCAWKNFAMAIYNATEGQGFEIFDDFSKRWTGGEYNAEETLKAWNQIEGSPPNRIGAGTIFYLANEASPGWRQQYELGKMAKIFNISREEEPPDTVPAFSEEALALAFAERHADNLRYVAAWNKWLRFDGKQWRSDETRETFSDARKLCREAACGINKPERGKAVASAKTRAAVVSLAGEDRRLAATIDQWDADPWLLEYARGRDRSAQR